MPPSLSNLRSPLLIWLPMAVLALGLAACSPAATPSAVLLSDAPASAPSAGPASETPIPTLSPLTNATPPIIIEPAQPEPTFTPTPPQVGLPLEAVAIFNPGPGSQVVSPLSVRGFGGPSYNQRLHFRLFGEDGRLLSQARTYLYSYPGNPGRFVAELPFNIQNVAEEGRLEVSVDSVRDGRRWHVASVSLILLSEGTPRIHRAMHGAEKLNLFLPRPNQYLSNGNVRLSGAGWTESDLPLVAEVLDRDGSSIGRVEFVLTSDEPGELGIFDLELAYQVDRTQPGQVIVYENSKSIPGIIHLTAVDVFLSP
jgi:hypothetical protein